MSLAHATRRLGVIVIAGIAAAAFAAPVSAGAPLQHEHYSGTDSGEECDGAFTRETTFSGLAIIRDTNPARGGEFFMFSDNYQYRHVITNVETGKSFTISGNGSFHEIQPREIGDGVFTYVSHDSGQPFVVRDSAGRVVLRDRGTITVSYVFDSLNDGQPGGQYLQDPELVRVSGPHPGLDVDLCALGLELTA